MKNYNFLLILFIVSIFYSCQNEYQQPDKLTDVCFYTSFFRNKNLNSSLNQFSVFTDLSQGALSHRWEVSEGCQLMEGAISAKETVFTKYFVPGLVSTQNTINVLYTKGGNQTIRLYNTFADSVTFRGAKLAPAKKNGNVWVMDTTITVHVYVDIVPEYKITQNEVDVAANQDTIFVAKNGSLKFTDLTTIGEPLGRKWSVAGMTNTTTVATFVFKIPGIYNATLTSTRAANVDLNIPGSSKTITLKPIIKVLP